MSWRRWRGQSGRKVMLLIVSPVAVLAMAASAPAAHAVAGAHAKSAARMPVEPCAALTGLFLRGAG